VRALWGPFSFSAEVSLRCGSSPAWWLGRGSGHPLSGSPRGRLFGSASASSRTTYRALTLRGNREWSLRPDYPNPLPHSRVGVPKCNNQSVGFDGLLLARPRAVEGGWCGLTGAGSIRGCLRTCAPAAPLKNRSRRTRSSRPRGEPENDSSTIHLARGVGGIRNEHKPNGRTKPAVGTPRKSAYLPSSLNTSRAAETVSAMSCAVCAALTNPAS